MDLGRPQDKAPKPPARLVLTTPEHFIAFGFGAGLSPIAPGTVGTLVGVPIWSFLSLFSGSDYVGGLILLIIFGIWICGESSRLLGLPDCPGIVFDEIAGFCIAATPLLSGFQDSFWLGLLLAFVLFRIFDILKPWPIRWLDSHVHGGFGIMLDDLVAGAYAALVLGVIGWMI